MNYLAGITLAAAVLFNAGALAEDGVKAGDGRQVVALADTPLDNAATNESAMIERFTGCYATEDGLVFVVSRDAGRLTIDLPENWGLGRSRLRAENSQSFVLDVLPMHVRFEMSTAGVVTGLVVHDAATNTETEAIKLPDRRGVVSIYDVDETTGVAIAATR